MAYRLKLKTTLALEVRRIALEQIDIARSALARRDDRAAGVHDARRSLKRLRAMLRLVRPALGETWFKQSNRQLAGLGQRLSQSRDLDVMVVTLSKLENGSGGLAKDVAERLRRTVARGRSLANGASRPASDRTLGGALQRAEKLFAAERLRGLALVHVAAGLEQSYRKARRTFRAAYQEESDETFSVLLAFAQKNGATGLAAADLDTLRASCLKGQRQIRDVARLHAERLFADRPRQLTKRILRYWKAAEQLSTLLPPDREPQPSPARPIVTDPRPARAGSLRAHATSGKKAARRRSRPRPSR
jgi:CHAD domain-containing protein